MIWVTPVRYLQYRSNEPEPRYVYLHFSEANLGVWVLIVPIILAGLAVSLTRRQRPFALLGLTCVFGLYCFVTGFSTGSGYLPAAGALVLATVVALSFPVDTRQH